MPDLPLLQVGLEVSADELRSIISDDLIRIPLTRPDHREDLDDVAGLHLGKQCYLHPLTVLVSKCDCIPCRLGDSGDGANNVNP